MAEEKKNKEFLKIMWCAICYTMCQTKEKGKGSLM